MNFFLSRFEISSNTDAYNRCRYCRYESKEIIDIHVLPSILILRFQILFSADYMLSRKFENIYVTDFVCARVHVRSWKAYILTRLIHNCVVATRNYKIHKYTK